MNCERCTTRRRALDQETMPAVAYVKPGERWMAVCEDCRKEARRIAGLAASRNRTGPIILEGGKIC